MNDFMETDSTEVKKKELSKPMKNLIRFLAKVAVDEYLEEEKKKAENTNPEKAV